MSGDRLPTRQQRVINHLITKGWEENGAPHRLKKGNRRVCVGTTHTSFSIQTVNGPDFFESIDTKDFKSIQDAS